LLIIDLKSPLTPGEETLAQKYEQVQTGSWHAYWHVTPQYIASIGLHSVLKTISAHAGFFAKTVLN
jgi:hypothetical protein